MHHGHLFSSDSQSCWPAWSWQHMPVRTLLSARFAWNALHSKWMRGAICCAKFTQEKGKITECNRQSDNFFWWHFGWRHNLRCLMCTVCTAHNIKRQKNHGKNHLFIQQWCLSYFFMFTEQESTTSALLKRQNLKCIIVSSGNIRKH